MKYIYPVVSRRSEGLSIGVNICGRCNFSCVYCQVLGETPDQHEKASVRSIDPERLEKELREVLFMVLDGTLFEDEPFKSTPPEKRRLNDIALSGDGEPTLSPQFSEVVALLVKIREEFLSDPKYSEYFQRNGPFKLVLITNATALHVKHVARSIQILLENGGEIWAKLDAGTGEFYEKISRSRVPFERILHNLSETAQIHPIVIQSLFLCDHGKIPSEEEIGQYIERIREILRAGGRIRSLQIYTVARNPPDPNIRALSREQVEQIASRVQIATAIPVNSYFSE